MSIASILDRRINIPHNSITWFLIAGLFFLRIVLAGIVLAWLKISPVWLYPTYEIGTYFLSAILIWWERENLAEFFIDKLVLIILVLGKPYELLLNFLQIPFPHSLQSDSYWLYLPISLGLLMVILFSRPKLNKITTMTWLWVIVGIVTGIILGIFAGYLLRSGSSGQAEKLIPLWLSLPTQQIVRSGINEEPFFRGFLWGGLRRLGWKDTWILFFQTALFMLGHIYYWRFPFAFWIVVPLVGLLTGVLVWRSHSLSTGMASHGLMNAVSQMVHF